MKAGEAVKVSVKVKNSGARPGKEVVQVYVSDEESSLARPPKELKGFKKVALEPGEATLVEFELRPARFILLRSVSPGVGGRAG